MNNEIKALTHLEELLQEVRQDIDYDKGLAESCTVPNFIEKLLARLQPRLKLAYLRQSLEGVD